MQFQPGNQNAVGHGRPKRGKNSLESIRRKVLYMLEHRLNNKQVADSISTEDLLRFCQSLMPRDISLKVAPDIQYISNTPRPSQCLEDANLKKLEDKRTNEEESL